MNAAVALANFHPVFDAFVAVFSDCIRTERFIAGGDYFDLQNACFTLLVSGNFWYSGLYSAGRAASSTSC